jgi:hypothetical protein
MKASDDGNGRDRGVAGDSRSPDMETINAGRRDDAPRAGWFDGARDGRMALRATCAATPEQSELLPKGEVLDEPCRRAKALGGGATVRRCSWARLSRVTPSSIIMY